MQPRLFYTLHVDHTWPIGGTSSTCASASSHQIQHGQQLEWRIPDSKWQILSKAGQGVSNAFRNIELPQDRR